MFQIIANSRVVRVVENPYAIVLKDSFSVVRIGEKEEMEEVFESMMKKNQEYEPSPKNQQLLYRVQDIFHKHDIEVEVPEGTKETALQMMSEFLLVPVPKDQKEIDNVMNITGYLKKYYENYNF